MALSVRVIKKFYDKDNKLMGYRLMDPNGNVMDIGKDAVKQAAASGQISIENMTLTSDGRLIGKASKKPNKTVKPQRPVVNVIEVYTNGRNIPGALIEDNSIEKDNIPGIQSGYTFDTGIDYKENLKNGWYANTKIEDKKIVGNFKKKSFKAVKNKMLAILSSNGINPEVEVRKANSNSRDKEYEICINNSAAYKTPILQLTMCLLLDSMYTEGIQPLYIEDDVIHVKSVGKIGDVRKAVDLAFTKVETPKKSKEATETKSKTAKAKKK